MGIWWNKLGAPVKVVLSLRSCLKQWPSPEVSPLLHTPALQARRSPPRDTEKTHTSGTTGVIHVYPPGHAHTHAHTFGGTAQINYKDSP